MFREPQPSVSPDVAHQEMDSQEITLRSSEARTVSSEECETRVVNGRRVHKRTVTTESRESKTEVHESTLPTAAPSVARPAANRQTPATESPAKAPLPPQVRLSIANVESADAAGASRFVGDYILDPIAASAPERRWRLHFPAHCGLFQAELTATPLAGGGQQLRAGLSGSQQGPQWSGEANQFHGPTVLRSEPQHVGSAIAGCYWPSHVIVAPLQLPAAKERFHIPPESTLEEILILSGSCGSDGSCDWSLVDGGSGVELCRGPLGLDRADRVIAFLKSAAPGQAPMVIRTRPSDRPCRPTPFASSILVPRSGA